MLFWRVDFTASLQTQAIRDELNEVQSLIESLTLEGGKTTGASKLQTQISTPGDGSSRHTKEHEGQSKMAAPYRRTKVLLRCILTKLIMQEEFKSLEDSPGTTFFQAFLTN